MKKKIILITISSILIWFGGFLYFINYSKSFKLDYSIITDAIVVFTGGKERIRTGADLLRAGYSPILFISGVESPSELKKFLDEFKVKQEQVFYGVNAKTTKHNANELAEFVISHNIRSIRLVTSSYHMPRALLETLNILPKWVRVIPHPVFQDQQNYLLLFKEYNKLIMINILAFIN